MEVVFVNEPCGGFSIGEILFLHRASNSAFKEKYLYTYTQKKEGRMSTSFKSALFGCLYNIPLAVLEIPILLVILWLKPANVEPIKFFERIDAFVVLATLLCFVQGGLVNFRRKVNVPSKIGTQFVIVVTGTGALVIGVLEEICYRYLLPLVLTSLTGMSLNWALVVALIYFALMHALQKPRGVRAANSLFLGAIWTIIALHYGLAFAMAGHFLADFGGFVVPALKSKWTKPAS